MEPSITRNTICTPSDDVVTRDIEGEIIIVPIAAGIGDAEDELYSLNETGKAIWDRMDGIHSLSQIAIDLAAEYAVSLSEIERDVIGLVTELARRNMLIIRKED